MNTVAIIGTGPSLTVEQMNLVKGLTTFGCGELIAWKDLPYVPDWYAIAEEQMFVKHHMMLERSSANLVAALPNPREHFPSIKEKERYNRTWEYLVPDKWRWRTYSTSHDTTIERDAWGPQTVDQGCMIVCWPCSAFIGPLQYAVWAGVKEILLLGIDLSQGYINDDTVLRSTRDIALHQDSDLEVTTRRVFDRCAELGVKITNCSPGYTELGIPKSSLERELHLTITDEQVREAKMLPAGEYTLPGNVTLDIDKNDYGLSIIARVGNMTYDSQYVDNTGAEGNYDDAIDRLAYRISQRHSLSL